MFSKHLRKLATVSFTAALALAGVAALLWLLGWLPPMAHAQGGTGTIYVNISTGTDTPGCGAPGSPCRTIKYAVETEAQSGDTVSVAPGTYTETLDMRPGVIISGSGASVTFIDGQGVRGPMVRAMVADITGSATLRGFTVQGGTSSAEGGGLYIASKASPLIEDCVIQGNAATLDGGGIEILDASPTVQDTVVLNNRARSGGGIAIVSGSPLIESNIIYSNTATDGGGFDIWESTSTLRNNVVYHNTATNNGGGMHIYAGTPTLQNNTIYSNTAGWGSGIYLRNYTSPTISNNIVVNNTAGWGGGIALTNGAPSLDYNDVWGNVPDNYSNVTAGTNSISADPLLVDPGSGDLRLGAGSPCIDTGMVAGFPTYDIRGITRPVDGDVNGTATSDMGAYEYASCDVGLTISCGQQVNGDTTGHVKTHVIYPACTLWDESGPEDIYAFTLAVDNAQITATLSNLGVDLDVFLLSDCATAQCFSYGDAQATASNLPAGTYYIAVDGYNGVAGSYTLNLECSEKKVYLPLVLKSY